MKIRSLGLATGLMIGGSLMAGGLFIMSFGDTQPGGAGIMIVLGALVFIPGAIIALVSFFGWAFATVYKSLGDDGKRVVKWGLLAVVVSYLAYTAFAVWDAVDMLSMGSAYRSQSFPATAATLGAGVVAPDVWAKQETKFLPAVAELGAGDEVTLVGFGSYRMSDGYVHAPFTHGYPWFEVKYGDGLRGFMWGGRLCATEEWINGLNRKCPFVSLVANEGETNEILELIENGYETLPGMWQEVSSRNLNQEITILVVHPQQDAENNYATRTQRYYNEQIYEGSWELLLSPLKTDGTEQSTERKLEFTISSRQSVGTYSGRIEKLTQDELILAPNFVYKRVLNPDALIEQWQEQVAEIKRIRKANEPRAEINKKAPTEIKGLSNALEYYYEEPFTVKSHGGKIRSGPGTQFKQVGSLSRGGTVHVLAVTDVEMDDFLWYRIRYGKGYEGYVLGALICAKEYWVEKIHHHCPQL